jgi:hypothetical protein
MQYDNSTIRKFLTNYYEQALPTSLQKNIKTVNKATIQGADYNTATIKYVVPNSEYNKTLCCNKVVTSERCFIMSIKEAFGEYNWITEYDEAEQYQYFAINGLDYEYNSTDAYMGSSYGSLRDTYNQISNISREIDPYGYRIYANGARYELSSIDLGGIIYWFNPCFSI